MDKMPFLFAKKRERLRLRKAVKHGELVRLHVVAAGDGEEEQRVKLRVRDAIIGAFSTQLAGAKDSGEAFLQVQGALMDIQRVAREQARKEGYNGPVRAMAGVYPFPVREYDGVAVPAGNYRALRVVLGTGAGRNWWCILYPALCLSAASKDPVDAGAATFHWHLPDIFRLWF